MTDIVLIQPPVEDFYFTFKRSIPYGLAAIAATLMQAGHAVEIVDALAVKKSVVIPYPQEMAFLEEYYGTADRSHFSLFHQYRRYGYSFEHLGNMTRDKSPLIVGISSLFTPYAETALKTARMVKKFCPRAVVVMGGHHPTRFPEWVMEEPSVDFVLRGEGEVGMALLVERIKKEPGCFIPGKKGGCVTFREREAVAEIPGIVFRKETGGLWVTPPAWMPTLENRPLPALDLVNQKFYQRNNRGSAVVVAGRGCPMPCTYCSVGASSRHSRFRLRPVDQVLEEIRQGVVHHDVRFIDFEDENLTLNRKWCISLLQGICDMNANGSAVFTGAASAGKFLREKEKTGVVFSAGCFPEGERLELRAMNGLYPPSLDDALVGLMKKAGFQTLNLSLGSTDAAQLAAFRRPDVRRSHDSALQLAEEYGMAAVSYLIAGAPGQDPRQSVRDLLFLAARRTLAGLSIYYPAPGSVDYDLCAEKNILPSHFSLMRSTALPIEYTTTRLASVTLLRLARILNFMKSLLDQQIPLPPPSALPARGTMPDTSRRTACSLLLLQAFLHDGGIRGITPEGQVFDHSIDMDLSRMFLAGLSELTLCGTV